MKGHKMSENNIETLNSEIAEFHEKYKNINRELKDGNFRSQYLADADVIFTKYQNSEGEVRERLGKFCNFIGCWTVVYGKDLGRGIPYYHKALELCPDSYDIHYSYFTTLEELIPKKKYSTPELVQDAIDCLTFCIDYCTTPALMAENQVDCLYYDLAKAYKIAGQPEKAAECEKMAVEIGGEE